jgi:hypothetical protein
MVFLRLMFLNEMFYLYLFITLLEMKILAGFLSDILH